MDAYRLRIPINNTNEPRREPRVLIIDDDELIAGSLSSWLVANGWICDVAHDTEAARSMMRGRPYEVVLVDPYLTGGMDDGVAEIRAMQPDAKLIVATAYASPQLRVFNDDQVIRLVEKPQPISVLSSLVIDALGHPHVKPALVPPDVRRDQ